MLQYQPSLVITVWLLGEWSLGVVAAAQEEASIRHDNEDIACEDKRCYTSHDHGLNLLQRADQVARGFRGSVVPRNGNTLTNHSSKFVLSVDCHETFVSRNLPLGSRCPEICPFLADAEKPCDFQCVAAVECGQRGNPRATVADPETQSCRKCQVHGCKACAATSKDVCAVCDPGYHRSSDGSCAAQGYTWSLLRQVVRVLWYLLGLVVLIVIAWYIDLVCQPVTNQRGADRGIAFRARSILHPPISDLPFWPLQTNLCKTNVAGPGTMLSFQCQFMLITWTLVMEVAWVSFGFIVDKEYFSFGWTLWRNHLELCSSVWHGWHKQHQMMAAKAGFVLFAYAFTTCFALLHAIRQRRTFQKIDNTETTMADFAVYCCGLPIQQGQDHVEQELKAFFQNKTDLPVVGVSVLWKFYEHLDEIMAALDDFYPVGSTESTENDDDEDNLFTSSLSCAAHPPRATSSTPTSAPAQRWAAFFITIDAWIIWTLGAWPRKDASQRYKANKEDSHSSDWKVPMPHILKSMKTSGYAYVVFESENHRDAALEALADGIIFKEHTVTVVRAESEPEAVIWENVGTIEEGGGVCLRFSLAACGVLLWIVVLVVVFLKPFTIIQKKYSNDLPWQSNVLFQIAIGLCMVTMFNLCDLLSGMVGFITQGSRQAAYGVLYFSGMFIMVVIDLALTCDLKWSQLANDGVHSHDGTLIVDINNFADLFASYPMQKLVGDSLFWYCVPFTFILCFVCESLFLGWFFHHMCDLLVRTHPELTPIHVEKLCSPLPMDFGRYADMLLNMSLLVLAFFFPSGNTHLMLGAMLAGQGFVYVYDHYRVLRIVRGFQLKSNCVDQMMMYGMIIPCGLLAAIFIFKSNCVWSATVLCANNDQVLRRMIFAFCAHGFLHWVLLTYVAPMFDIVKVHGPAQSFKDYARKNPQSWFSVNPIHCLRSALVYKHKPACSYFVRGKEHLMTVNVEACSWYCDIGQTASLERLSSRRNRRLSANI